jgi:hypothetical protein
MEQPSKLRRTGWIVALSSVALGTLVLAGGILLASAAVTSLGTTRTLRDFDTPAEARAFTSAHLPTALPADATVQDLLYERWTDWHFRAVVRLASTEQADRFLEEVAENSSVNPSYCGEATGGPELPYFLASVSACGSVRRLSAHVLEVECSTR